ncbi:hypothetical protein GCM10027418_01040 [Mariniluteicoccus endophyticus]
MSRTSRAVGGALVGAFALSLLTPLAAQAAPSGTASAKPSASAKGSSTNPSARPTATSGRPAATPQGSATSYDDRVIFQSFSLFQPNDAKMYNNFAANAQQLNQWGITDIWLPPPYRSFGMARYMEGYAIADRYDLGEFDINGDGKVDPTKYGTATELKSLVDRLHSSNFRVQVDLVPNQMMGLSGREAVVGTRTDNNGNPFVNRDGRRTDFVDQIYLPYTKGGGPGQAKYGSIKEFNKSHWNGTSLQQIGFGDTLKGPDGRPYRVDQPNAADNNVPAWLNTSLGHNTVDGYLSAHDAYELSAGNWRPYLVNDPAFVTYAKAKCGFADENAVKNGAGSTSIWDCRDAFVNRLQDYRANPQALPGTKYNYWGEDPSLQNIDSGIDDLDQVRFKGHTINQGFVKNAEFLVGNDFDNSNPTVQAEQRNWVKFLLDQYKVDGFRIDAAGHYDTKILDMISAETRAKFGGDPARYMDYLETYQNAQGNQYVDATGNQILQMDAWGFAVLHDSLSRATHPVMNLWRFSDAQRSGDRTKPEGGDFRPNWSFVNNHDQEKNLVNRVFMDQNGIPANTPGCTGGPTRCRSFDAEWTKEKENRAIQVYNADLAAPSSQKRWSPRNVPAMYAAILTNKATTPTVYYGDMFRTDGAYMAEKTPYYDEIDALLKARKSYAKGEQRAYEFSDKTAATVRLGADRATGMATVISTDPAVNQTVVVDMGRDHANQKFRDVLGKSTQVLTTDATGKLAVPVRGSNNTAEVNGYLGVWAPVDSTINFLVRGAIEAKWQTVSGQLGGPTTPEYCGMRDGGCYQHFQNGSIYWSPATGAHFVRGAIFQKWGSQDWERGWLGYPITDETCGLKDGGCYQHFQGGSIYWTPATGARFITGMIKDKWASMGWENSRLGYPVTDESCGLKGGGCYQHFQGGSIYWSPATGAHFVVGLIKDRWASMGWENSFLGYPTTDEFCTLRDGGCGQHYQGGSIYWSPATGARVVTGLIRDHWARNGWETGRYGYPLAAESCGTVGGARQCTQPFQGGTITWNANRGTY